MLLAVVLNKRNALFLGVKLSSRKSWELRGHYWDIGRGADQRVAWAGEWVRVGALSRGRGLGIERKN